MYPSWKPESKKHSMEWTRPQLSSKKKFKIQPSVLKQMLTDFWDLLPSTGTLSGEGHNNK
jgi:hypothetical protein